MDCNDFHALQIESNLLAIYTLQFLDYADPSRLAEKPDIELSELFDRVDRLMDNLRTIGIAYRQYFNEVL